MTHQDLAGVWDLKIFEITDPEGTTRLWGKNTTGKIIYTESGYVSCAFNSDPEMANPSFEDLYDCLLFYVGTYTIPGPGKIIHHVCNASDRSRIGKDLHREIKLDGGVLSISSVGDFGKSRAVWEKTK
jgi:hypothetical protein